MSVEYFYPTPQEIYSPTIRGLVELQEKHLAAYYRQMRVRKKEALPAEQVAQEGESRQFEQNRNFNNSPLLESDPDKEHQSESLGGSFSDSGRGNTTSTSPFPPSQDDDPSLTPAH